MTHNKQAIYYTPPGSYDGLIKVKGRWMRALDLNQISKIGWVRWQGPPSERMEEVLKQKYVLEARALFPELEILGHHQAF